MIPINPKAPTHAEVTNIQINPLAPCMWIMYQLVRIEASPADAAEASDIIAQYSRTVVTANQQLLVEGVEYHTLMDFPMENKTLGEAFTEAVHAYVAHKIG